MDDPGWKPAVRGAFARLLMPWRWFGPPGRHVGGDGLTIIRAVWLSLLMSLFLFLFVMSFIAFKPADEGVWPYVVAALGVISLLQVQRIRMRPLDGSDPQALVKSYTTSFYIGFALGEVPALLSFVAVFGTGRLRIYLVGMAFSVVALLMIAPSRANLDRQQRRLRERGSSLSLVETLRTMPHQG